MAGRYVLDTNVIISAVLLPRSKPRQAFDKAKRDGKLLVSDEVIEELNDVLRRDDQFLSLATSGNADCIVSGDKDLLVLNPFHEIPIVTPAQFLEWV